LPGHAARASQHVGTERSSALRLHAPVDDRSEAEVVCIHVDDDRAGYVSERSSTRPTGATGGDVFGASGPSSWYARRPHTGIPAVRQCGWRMRRRLTDYADPNKRDSCHLTAMLW